jgi:hypothetical protein
MTEGRRLGRKRGQEKILDKFLGHGTAAGYD